LAATGFTGAFATVLAGVFAVVFEVTAFAAVFLGGIALLLFFEDFAAVAFPAGRARLLDALRLAAAAFLDGLEVLFLRVFCDTACAWNCHAPVRWFSRKACERVKAADRFSSECTIYSTFSGKINGLEGVRARFRPSNAY
jgi:hypothetical protein